MTHDFKWRHFRGEIILWAVRWYCRYGISYRDLEEMLEERGVAVDHTTIYRRCSQLTPRFLVLPIEETPISADVPPSAEVGAGCEERQKRAHIHLCCRTNEALVMEWPLVTEFPN